MFDFADIQGGHYNKFNTPNNLDLKKDYIVLETLGLKGIILDVVLVSLASSIKSEFWKEGISREKTLDIDEGWMYKDNQIVVKILEDNARTLRKSKSGQGFITQGIEDFSANSSMQTLFSSSFHKFLLSQDKKEIQKVANGKFFPLDQYELRTFESVANKRPYWGEACYMSKKIGSNALILKASPKVYWAAAGADPDGNKEFDSIKNIHDFDNIQTIRYMTYKKKYPEMNENDLVFKSKTYSEQEMISEEERYKYWHDEIKNALKNKRIQVRAEPIYSIENNTLYGYEIFSQIKHSDQTTSSYGIIMKWLHEFQMIEEYNLYVYNRAFRYFEDIDKNIHVNISTEEIRNKGFIEKLLSLIQSYRIESKLVIELKDTVNNDNIEELQEFIKKLKSMKIKIALDNIGVHYHKMSYLMMLDVDFINIDKELTKFTKDEPASLVLELVAAFVRKDSKKKLVALKVETQEELKMIKEKNFDFYQGWILKEDEFVI
jgi:EAL domain-containing protein (putative c-di-GMP-specific phosphodiesterase class I)